MDTTDVLVLGAGPGGCAAAITAAKAGLRVLILERATSHRHRPGETLHPGVEPLLRRLGAYDGLLDAGYLRHPGAWAAWNGLLRFEAFGADAQGPWLGFQAMRSDFDARLLSAAKRAGAAVRNGAAAGAPIIEAGRVVGIRSQASEVRARFIVDACGDRHHLARQLGIPLVRYSRPLLARYGYVQGCCPTRDAAPLFAADDHGWTWSARVGQRLYNWTRLDWRKGHPRPDWRPPEFADMADEGPTRAANVTWRLAEQVAGDGFFLVGDAAAVLDPASSHGVLRAIMSGMFVAHKMAQIVHHEIDETEAIASYQAWLAEWFLRDLGRLQEFYGQLWPQWLLTPEVQSCGPLF